MQIADLARGTFGFVQLAEDLTTGEHLAIKVCFWLTLAGTDESVLSALDSSLL